MDGSQFTPVFFGHFHADLLRRVTPAPPEIAEELAARGLVSVESSPASTRLLGAALSWIIRLQDLASLIYASVTDIHFLESETGYDVSHSEPRWRSTIFVSVPDRSDDIGALRLAESVVHEAMHLHLTNREQETWFVKESDGTMCSPWRAERRPFQGVLHGLYVFSCLSFFFKRLIVDEALVASSRVYLTQRLTEIEGEVQSIDFVTLASGLTERGVALMEECAGVVIHPYC
ncbi:aKG-HExxH-type peptide beta-hydroxylase [Novacetimonas pomaceti]